MSRDAIKLALEALEMSHELDDTGYADAKKYGLASDEDITEKLSTAITALREALAEQQEPVFAIRLLTNQCFALAQERDELQKQVWRYEKNGVTCQTYRHKVDASCSECNVHEVYTSPPAQQEPVAWMTKTGSVWKTKADKTDEPLYTSLPAQRTWVGLTDEEITDIWAESSPYYHEDDFARAIEAKLKEKNT